MQRFSYLMGKRATFGCLRVDEIDYIIIVDKMIMNGRDTFQ